VPFKESSTKESQAKFESKDLGVGRLLLPQTHSAFPAMGGTTMIMDSSHVQID